jgi:hypothetical protein
MFYSTEQTENVKPLGANLPMMMAGEMAMSWGMATISTACVPTILVSDSV